MPSQPSFTVTFWGATRTVTGSMHHISVGGKDYLLECGMFQGRRQQAYQRNKEIPFDVSKLTSMVLSHAHIARNVRRVFLVHGEPDAQGAFQKTIEDELHLPVHCSTRGEIFRLD